MLLLNFPKVKKKKRIKSLRPVVVLGCSRRSRHSFPLWWSVSITPIKLQSVVHTMFHKCFHFQPFRRIIAIETDPCQQ